MAAPLCSFDSCKGLSMSAYIIGWSHSKFGNLADETIESLIVEAGASAIADAGLEPGDIDAIFVGTMNAGMTRQEFVSSLPLAISDDLRFKPATRVENACATGSAAVYQARNAIAAGAARRVLVIGAEKMTELGSAAIGDCLIKASYLPEEGETQGGFAGVFAGITDTYFQRYGDKSDVLAHIAAKNHRNGVANPYAHVRKDLGYEFCRGNDKNPLVAGRLRRTDCSMISDGAAALVLADADTADAAQKAIAFRSAVHVSDFLPVSKRDIVAMPGPSRAWRQALADAGVGLEDLSLVETHDCFTTAELLAYEAMGLTPQGQGERAILEGWTEKGGKLPVNPSGGLKAKGHPIGATGVSMHVLAAMQLQGAAGDFQVPDAKLVGLFNMGGSAVVNYVSILEARK
ncbi:MULTISPECIES: acetyl-CoA acetyltransferase [Sphingobium]|nr:acetyl-CoA acetyltransferase [Sphingobium indicum]